MLYFSSIFYYTAKMVACRLKIKIFLFILLSFIVTGHASESYFTELVRKGVIATARTCMTATNATEHDLHSLRSDPPFPEKTACIVKCLLEKIGIVKNNRFSHKGFVTVVGPLVFKNTNKMEHYRTVADNCVNEVNHKEETPCQIGNEITTCIFKYAPELHFKS